MIKALTRLYNYYFSADREFIQRLYSLVGYTPVNSVLFKLAFFHKSGVNERHSKLDSNERLEYLGDAVLSSVVAEYLFKKYPNGNEGFLTKMRSKIVKRKTLNDLADQIGIDVLLKDFNNHTQLTTSMMGNALEAFLGAMYLETGHEFTKRYITRKLLKEYMNIHDLESFDDNYKSQLLEWCQKYNKEIGYSVVEKSRMNNRDYFKVAVLVDGQVIATAEDFNKKSAEQLASERAIESLGLHDEE